MTRKRTRREFLRDSALTGAGLWLAGQAGCARPIPRPRRMSPNEKLNIAGIGIAGQGAYDLKNVETENIVAICDVDEPFSAGQRARYAGAKFFTDYRRMLDEMDASIDAVVIATPDHSHAPATLRALQAGKHVYCEKPLTHSVAECRQVMELAQRARVATQMGTQIHAQSNYRRVVELVKSGAIGAVTESHVWCDKQWSGGDVPTETPAVPEGLAYDLWLGPASYRPYSPAYLPANWRGWWDFGGGTLADMACHHIDLSHWALDLRTPISVEAEGPPVHPASCPPWLIVRYVYPARGDQPAVRLTWYHGGKRPPQFDEGKLPKWGSAGTLFVGEKGMLLADYDKHVLLPEEAFADFQPLDPFIPDSIGHHQEWIRACKTGSPTLCHFDYAGPLTETVLLGNVAYRSGRRLEWNSRRLTAANAPEADAFIDPPHRKGWMV